MFISNGINSLNKQIFIHLFNDFFIPYFVIEEGYYNAKMKFE